MGNATGSIKKRTGHVPTGDASIVDITIYSSYATGGDTGPLAALELEAVDVLVLTGGTAGHGAEGGQNASAAPHRRPRVGAPPATPCGRRGAAAGARPFLEEANATNVSTVVVRAFVIGDLPNI